MRAAGFLRAKEESSVGRGLWNASSAVELAFWVRRAVRTATAIDWYLLTEKGSPPQCVRIELKIRERRSPRYIKIATCSEPSSSLFCSTLQMYSFLSEEDLKWPGAFADSTQNLEHSSTCVCWTWNSSKCWTRGEGTSSASVSYLLLNSWLQPKWCPTVCSLGTPKDWRVWESSKR